MKPPAMLIYNIDEDKKKKLKRLAMRLKIRVREVKKEELGQTLSALCAEGELSAPEYLGEGFPEEMMLMAYFPQGMVNALLNGMRREQIPTIRLKAVLTEHNSLWTLLSLHDELEKEDEWFRRNKTPMHEESPKPE